MGEDQRPDFGSIVVSCRVVSSRNGIVVLWGDVGSKVDDDDAGSWDEGIGIVFVREGIGQVKMIEWRIVI